MFNQSSSNRMNRTQITIIMKSFKHISALSVVASTLLSSCTLLVSSPLPSSDHANNIIYHSGKTNGYDEIFQVPAKGGVYEFDCANDQYSISILFDSSMPLPVPRKQSNCRCYQASETSKPITVKGLTYSGPFYTITRNADKHNWIITIDPLTTMSGESDEREVLVSVWDEPHDLVFKFKQSDFEPIEYIH